MPDLSVVQFDGRLSNVATAYRNDELIADLVIPREGVPHKIGKYKTYDKADRFTIPDTKSGPRTKPNEVDWGGSEATFECLDQALDDFVPQDDIDNAELPITPLSDSAEFISDLLALAREQRAAALVFASAGFASGYYETLSGNNRWSIAASDPVSAILGGIDTCFLRPDTLVLGAQTWRYLRSHATVLKAVTAQGQMLAPTGAASKAAVAALFELDQVVVGRARYNSAKKGQTAVYARLWGSHAALLKTRRETNKTPVHSRTFQFGSRVAGQIPDQQRGMRGGTLVRVGEAVVEKVIASDCGYLWTNAGDAT